MSICLEEGLLSCKARKYKYSYRGDHTDSFSVTKTSHLVSQTAALLSHTRLYILSQKTQKRKDFCEMCCLVDSGIHKNVCHKIIEDDTKKTKITLTYMQGRKRPAEGALKNESVIFYSLIEKAKRIISI